MVFNAALRKTGDRSTAEEVTQNVFTILARKAARLKNGSVLAGWLYRTAMFECSHALRRESSHKRKMEALAEQQLIQEECQPTGFTEELDIALGKLSQSDQNVLLLRFYEEMSFREIGRRLGKGEDASQKQASRALDRLGTVMRRRGVVLSATILTSALAAEFSKAAPAVIHAGVTKVAIAGAPSPTTATLASNSLEMMTYGKMIKCLTLVAILAAVPIAVQHSQLGAARSSLASSEFVSTKGNRPHPAMPDSLQAVKDPFDLARPKFSNVDEWLAHCITEHEAFASVFERRKELGKLTAAEQLALLHELERHPGAGEPKRLLIGDVIASMEKHSPTEALVEAVRLNDSGSASRILVAWAEDDPDAAVDWFLEQQAAGLLQSPSRRDPEASHESWMIWRLAEVVAAKDPQRAIEFAAMQDPKEARSALRGIALGYFQNGHKPNLSSLVSSLDLSEAEIADTIADAAAHQVPHDGAAAADWLLVHSAPDFVGENIATLMQVWSDSNSGAARDWIAVLGESNLRDHALSGLAEGFVSRVEYGYRRNVDPKRAREAAREIGDTAMRDATLELIEQRIADFETEEQR